MVGELEGNKEIKEKKKQKKKKKKISNIATRGGKEREWKQTNKY
jgi:hypothetical protein